MKHHQKSYVGNGMIKKHSDILYGKTDNFETFVYFSQLTQAKAVGMAISGHRVDWPRCSGTLYWQVNDCWPAPSWSSIDYFGNWKALHYQVQKDFENIAVLAVEKKLNEKDFYLVSDGTKPYNTDVCFDFYDLQGNWLVQHSFIVDVEPQKVVPLPVFSLMDQSISEYIVQASWKDEKGNNHSRIFENIKQSNLSKGEIKIDLISNENNEYTVVITNEKPIFNCWIYSEEKPFHLNQNFETLLPGKHEFKFTSELNFRVEDIKIRYL